MMIKKNGRLANEQFDRLNYMNCPGWWVWINEDTAATQWEIEES